MPMFGMGRFGGAGAMDEEEQRRMAAMYGNGGMDAQPIGMTRQAQQTLQNAPRMDEKSKSFWQGGEKFGVRDGIAGVLAAVGDGLANFYGNEPVATRTLMGTRLSALEEAKKARAAAEAAAREEQKRQQMRQEGLDDYGAKKRIDQQYDTPKAANVVLKEDNVGNQWRYDGATGQRLDDKPVYIERAPKFYIQGNAAIRIPNPWADSEEEGFDELPGGFRIQGGAASNGGGNFR